MRVNINETVKISNIENKSNFIDLPWGLNELQNEKLLELWNTQQVQRNVNKHTLIKDVLAFLNYTNQPPLVILTAESREKSEKYEL